MRRLFLALLSLAFAGSADAEEARLVPAVGVKLTYRLVTTFPTKTGDKRIAGQIYTYSITASDGMVAEGSVKFDAMLYPCKDKAGDPLCDRVLKTPGARPDGDLIFVPIPEDISASLAKNTVLRLRYFVVEKRVVWLPAPGAGDDLFSLDDPLRMTNEMDCDHDGLRSFRPIGGAQHVTLICTASEAHSGWTALGMKPVSSANGVKLYVVDLGPDKIDLPSGAWEIRRLKLSLISSDGGSNAEGEGSFSEKLGVAVRTRWTQALPSGAVSESESKLIAVTP